MKPQKQAKSCTFLITLILFSIFSSQSIAAQKEIQIAILMPAPAKKIYKNWTPLANYLSEKIGQPVKIVTPRGLDQAKKAVPDVDFVYANSYLYSLLKEDGEAKVSPVAQMKNMGDSIYSSGRFIARKDSDIKSVADLKGKKIALISPYGAGAYLAPRAYLMKQGIDIDNDVEVEFTSNLKKAAYMVMLGKADTAVMCNVNYDILSKKIDTGDLRIFDKTDSFPEALMFTRLDPESDLVKQITHALIDDNSDRAKALESLHKMKIHSFIAYDSKVEERTSALSKQAKLK